MSSLLSSSVKNQMGIAVPVKHLVHAKLEFIHFHL